MAKKGRNNGSPIEFQNPSAGGKGPRIPTPTNHEKWKYTSGKMGRPSPGEWAAIIVFFFIMVGVGFLLSIESWALTIAIWVVALIMPISFIEREMFFRKKQKSQKKPQIPHR